MIPGLYYKDTTAISLERCKVPSARKGVRYHLYKIHNSRKLATTCRVQLNRTSQTETVKKKPENGTKHRL